MIAGKRIDTGTPVDIALAPGNGILIGGVTGFGKSNEINYLIWQVVSNPCVALVLCNAAGKPDYMQWLPRANCIAVGKMATDYALDQTIDIMTSRYANLYPDIPDDISDEDAVRIAEATDRAITVSKDLPLVLVVVDEFVEYLKGKGGADRLRRLHTVLTIGRAAGLQCILSTQRPSDEQANTDIREQVPVRILFASDANASVMAFGPAGKGLPVDRIKIKGQGYVMTEGERFPLPFIAPECPESAVRQAASAYAHCRPKLNIKRFIDDNREETLAS